jgi:hypothetical protein
MNFMSVGNPYAVTGRVDPSDYMGAILQAQQLKQMQQQAHQSQETHMLNSMKARSDFMGDAINSVRDRQRQSVLMEQLAKQNEVDVALKMAQKQEKSMEVAKLQRQQDWLAMAMKDPTAFQNNPLVQAHILDSNILQLAEAQNNTANGQQQRLFKENAVANIDDYDKYARYLEAAGVNTDTTPYQYSPNTGVGFNTADGTASVADPTTYNTNQAGNRLDNLDTAMQIQLAQLKAKNDATSAILNHQKDAYDLEEKKNATPQKADSKREESSTKEIDYINKVLPKQKDKYGQTIENPLAKAAIELHVHQGLSGREAVQKVMTPPKAAQPVIKPTLGNVAPKPAAGNTKPKEYKPSPLVQKYL